MPNKPQYVILHTAAFLGAAGIERIDQWHRDRGFDMVGYHYYIRKDGTIQNGRHETRVGAHCRDMGMNHKSIGICFEGHGDFETWTAAQWNSYLLLINSVLERYSIPAENVMGHRETGANKTCPGSQIDMDLVRSITRNFKSQKVEPLPPEAFTASEFNAPDTTKYWG